MSDIKYFTKETLREANTVAIKTNRNRTLYESFVEALPELRFPIVFTFVHNDVEMRVMIAVNENAKTVWLDIPFETYEKLPSVDVPDHATIPIRRGSKS